MQPSLPSQRSASDIEAPSAPKDKRDNGVVETVGYPADASDDQGMFGGDGSFRTLGRWETAVVLFTNQVGLGILSLPNALRVLGIVPGVIAIVGIGLLSTYTAYELLQYWRAHPHVLNLVDMARVLGGRPLQVVVGVCFVLNFALTCASAGVTLSVALNTISGHAACTVLWIGVVMLLCWALCLPRTFRFVAKVGIPSTVSIVAAVLITTIGLGVTGPQGQPPGWEREIVVAGRPSFREGLSACLNIAYAYAGNSGFVSVFTEMRDPSRDFVPALTILQVASITLYVVIAIAIYSLAGDLVTSPALGSASVTVAKVAYGVALPALLATGVVFAHCAIKYTYVVALQAQHATHEATRNTRRSWGTWVGCASAFWLVAFVLANAIPAFSSILDVSSALFIAWFTFGISAVFYLDRLRTRKAWSVWDRVLVPLNVGIVGISLFMNGAGMWVAVEGLREVFSRPGVQGPFTCADNSLF